MLNPWIPYSLYRGSQKPSVTLMFTPPTASTSETKPGRLTCAQESILRSSSVAQRRGEHGLAVLRARELARVASARTLTRLLILPR